MARIISGDPSFVVPTNLFHRGNDPILGQIQRLSLNQLPPNRCHLFFPNVLEEEWRIITALEYSLFHPKTQLNKQFNVAILDVNGMQLIWCSFPKQFKETCLKISPLFGMAIYDNSRAFSRNGVTVAFPKHNDILFFTGERELNSGKLDRDRDDIMFIGNRLQASGID